MDFVGGSTVVNTAVASASIEAMAQSVRASASLGSKRPRENSVEGALRTSPSDPETRRERLLIEQKGRLQRLTFTLCIFKAMSHIVQAGLEFAR